MASHFLFETEFCNPAAGWEKGRVVVDAIREGRDAMHHHEDELRARREGRLVSLDEHVEPGDQVYVDGVPVESGRVIVMPPVASVMPKPLISSMPWRWKNRKISESR